MCQQLGDMDICIVVNGDAIDPVFQRKLAIVDEFQGEHRCENLR